MANITFAEGSNLQNSIYGKSQDPILMMIEDRAEAYEQRSVVKEIFFTEKSENYGEKITSMTAMSGFMPVGENGPHPVDGYQEGFSKFLEHVTWKDSFSISREIIEDTRLMDLRQKPNKFIKGYYRTREQFGAALLGNAIQGRSLMTFQKKKFSTTGADEECLFVTNHPCKVKGGDQSNKFADEFSADALDYAEERMQNYTGDDGELLDLNPDTILIPNLAPLKRKVFSVIGADKDPETANNGFNFQFGRWRVVSWPYLNRFMADGTMPWMLMDSSYNEDYGTLVWLDRTELELSSDEDKNTNAMIWRGYSRFIAGFNDWRGISCGGLTGGTQLVSSGA